MDIQKPNWGLCLWHSTYGDEFVHPSDLTDAKALLVTPSQAVWHCIEDVDGFLMIEHGLHRLRIQPIAFQQVQAPKFSVGDFVETLNGTYRAGTISGIGWHFKYQKEMYSLEVNGKQLGRRYQAEDLRRLSLP